MTTSNEPTPTTPWYSNAKPGLLVKATKGFSVGKGVRAPRITQFMRVVYKGHRAGSFFFSFSYGEEIIQAFDPQKFEPVVKSGEWQYVEVESKAA